MKKTAVRRRLRKTTDMKQTSLKIISAPYQEIQPLKQIKSFSLNLSSF